MTTQAYQLDVRTDNTCTNVVGVLPSGELVKRLDSTITPSVGASHLLLSNIGTNSHAAIDTNLATLNGRVNQGVKTTDSPSFTGLTLTGTVDVPASPQVLALNVDGVTVTRRAANTLGTTDHTLLTNIGVNSHAAIDTQLSTLNGRVNQAVNTTSTPSFNALVLTTLINVPASPQVLGIDVDGVTITKRASNTFGTTDHTLLTNIGTTTHTQIDGYINQDVRILASPRFAYPQFRGFRGQIESSSLVAEETFYTMGSIANGVGPVNVFQFDWQNFVTAFRPNVYRIKVELSLRNPNVIGDNGIYTLESIATITALNIGALGGNLYSDKKENGAFGGKYTLALVAAALLTVTLDTSLNVPLVEFVAKISLMRTKLF